MTCSELYHPRPSPLFWGGMRALLAQHLPCYVTQARPSQALSPGLFAGTWDAGMLLSSILWLI